MKQLNPTALLAMKHKIRLAMRLAMLGKGDQMNGHANRCYIANRHGRNIIRVSYDKLTRQYTFYGQESVVINDNIKCMFQLNNKGNK